MSLEWVNYHHLYYFYTIAKEGSIARASERLLLGQPTLSAQLKLLENSLATKLFERKQQRLHLTESGKVAYRYAEQIFQLGHEMVAALRDGNPMQRVQLQIGALDSVPKSLVHKVMARVYEKGSSSISVFEGPGKELFADLQTHKLDLLITNYPASIDSKSVYARSLAKFSVVIGAAPKYAKLKKDFPFSLHGQPFVLPTIHSQLRKDLDHFFLSHEIQVDRVAETQDTSLQVLLGTEGVGLLPLNELSAKEHVKKGQLIILGKLEGVFEEIFLLAADRKVRNPAAAELMNDKDIFKVSR